MTAIFGVSIEGDEEPNLKTNTFNAVKCAIEIEKKIIELNDKLKSENKEEIKVGIGLHSGEVLMGPFGSVERKGFAVIGESIVIAANIARLNQEFNTLVLLSNNIEELIKGKFELKPVRAIKIRGTDKIFKLYSPISVIED